MDHREKLLSIVKEKGPLLPAQINRALNTNVLFASAMLSEMVDQKKLKLSSLKIGGSPLYYCEGQEPELEGFAEKLDVPYFNAFKLLKEKKVLRDRDQQPAVRVCLREIKDFAVPLEVTANGSTDLFWKYYLVSDDDAKSSIKSYLESRTDRRPAKQPSDQRKMDRKKEVQAKISSMEKVSLPEPSHGGADQRVAEMAASESSSPPSITMTKLGRGDVPEFSYSPSFSFSTAVDTEESVKLQKKKEDPAVELQKALAFPEGDRFFERVKSFFDMGAIEIKDFGVVKKGSDFDFEVLVPSYLGPLKFYCKAKDKKKISEFDLHSAFVEGHIRKLPVFFLTKGELTAKAKSVLHKELKSIFFRRMDN